MKTLALVLCGLFAVGCLAQDMSKVFGERPERSTIDRIESRVDKNDWSRYIDSTEIIAAFNGILIRANRRPAGTTAQIGLESSERDSLKNNPYVASSPRFEGRTILSALYRAEIIAGGRSDSDTTGGSLNIGGHQVSGSIEHGSSTATLTIGLRNLTTMLIDLTVEVSAKVSSANVTNVDIGNWRQRFGLNFSNSSGWNAMQRRDIQALIKCLEKAETAFKTKITAQEAR